MYLHADSGPLAASIRRDDAAAAASHRVLSPGWLLLAVLAPIPLFWFGAAGLFEAWARPQFHLNAAAPVLSLLMFAHVLRTMPGEPARGGPSWAGVAIVAIALALALVGNLADIDDLVVVAFVAWIAGLLVIAFGPRRSTAFWAPLACLLLMPPLPSFVYAPVRGVLEQLAVRIGTVAAGALGAEPRIEGEILDWGTLQMTVADATSGLTQLLPTLYAALLFATFWRGPLWIRVAPLLLVVPVATAMSALTIGLVGVLVTHASPEQAERFLNASQGWVFQAACVAVPVMVISAGLLTGYRALADGKRDRSPGAAHPLPERSAGRPVAGPIATAALLSAAVAATFVLAPSPAGPQITRLPFSLFPPEVGSWSGSAAAIGPSTERILGADDYLNVEFVSRDESAPVSLWSAYYHDQTEGGAIHSPQVCIPNDGWSIVSFRSVDVALGEPTDGTIRLNRALIRKDEATSLVYYWFDGRGRRVAGEFRARLFAKLDVLVTGRTDGALVRFVTPVLPGEAEGAADARLGHIVALVAPLLARHIPE